MFNYRIIKLIFISISVWDIIEGGLLPKELMEHVENPTASAVCHSNSCKNSAQAILNSMDPTVDPCDDFYKFACGGFVSNSEIPAFANTYSTFSILDNTIYNQLKNLMEEEIEKNEIEPFKMIKQFYRDCLKADIIKDNALKIIGDKIKKMGGWPQTDKNLNYDNNSWISTLEESRNLGFESNYILSLTSDINYENASSLIIYVEKPYLRPHIFSSLYTDINYKTNNYFKIMVNLAMKNKMPFDKAVEELTPVLQFAYELANIDEDIDYVNQIINNNSAIVTIKDMHTQMPSMNWLGVINALLGNSLNVTEEEKVILVSPNYLKKLEKLLESTPPKILVNFILWRNIQESLHFYFIDSMEPKWIDCLFTIKQNLEVAVTAMYYRRYFSENTFKQRIVKIVQTFRKEQYNIISSSDWIDEETRKAALNKALSMRERIAYSEELLDDNILIENYKTLHLEPGNYYENLLKIMNHNINQTFASIRIPVNSSDLLAYKEFLIANPYYIFYENCLELPGVMFQENLYSEERPYYLNYGAIGFLIGHELSHAFDSTSYNFDADGNLRNWWQPKSKEIYSKKLQCFVKQYNEFVIEETGENINGTETLYENISDNEGIRIAYGAYKSWVRQHGPEKLLPGLNHTAEQLFWISSASSWCSKYRFLYMMKDLTRDEHSPDSIRILGAFSNQKEFAEDFKCPEGSRMNPVKKCSLW